MPNSPTSLARPGNGGARKGAGRKPGVPNKATAAARERIAESGQTPIDFLLDAMRGNDQDINTRLAAAKLLLPYTAPRPFSSPKEPT